MQISSLLIRGPKIRVLSVTINTTPKYDVALNRDIGNTSPAKSVLCQNWLVRRKV
jgi:hypothetical protein